MITERATAPKTTTAHSDALAFRFWAKMPLFLEDTKPWKLCASFRYLLEALDFVEYAKAKGCLCVFQSPAECRIIGK